MVGDLLLLLAHLRELVGARLRGLDLPSHARATPLGLVDVELRRQLWNYVRELNAQGTTILLTTHYLEEAEELCDRIAIIDRGGLIACEDKAKLLRRLDAKQMTFTLDADLEAVPDGLSAYHATLDAPRKITVRYPPSKVHSGEILAAVQGAGLGIVDLSTRETELEDIFLRLTSGEQEGPGENAK